MERYSDIIQRMLIYIEEHIKEEMTMDQVTEITSLSKYHIHRLFKTMTDRPLMEYVRNRKLSASLHELLNTDLKIIDIALEYGFDYEQTYIRAFKKTFRITPDRFRRERVPLEITDPLKVFSIQPIGEFGAITEPRILLKPAIHVIGVKHWIAFQENDRYHTANRLGNEFFYQQRQRIPQTTSPDVYLGVVEYIPDDYENKYYTTCIEAVNCGEPPVGMTGFDIPENKYAVFTHISKFHPRYLTMDDIGAIYEYIFKQWLPSSGYTWTGNYHIERIDMDVAQEDYGEIQLLFPIRNAIYD